jgi:hypothetical protein
MYPRRAGGALNHMSADTFQLHPGMSFGDWAAVGRRLSHVSSRATWALGDWLLFGERAFGERYRAAVEATNLEYQTLRNYAWVAGSFPPQRRCHALSFQHHAELAALSEIDQDLWLNRAVKGRWSRNELRRRVRAHRAGRDADDERPALVVRVELTIEDELRWRQAADSTQQDLMAWLRTVADAAAEAAIRPSAAAAI